MSKEATVSSAVLSKLQWTVTLIRIVFNVKILFRLLGLINKVIDQWT